MSDIHFLSVHNATLAPSDSYVFPIQYRCDLYNKPSLKSNFVTLYCLFFVVIKSENNRHNFALWVGKRIFLARIINPASPQELLESCLSSPRQLLNNKHQTTTPPRNHSRWPVAQRDVTVTARTRCVTSLFRAMKIVERVDDGGGTWATFSNRHHDRRCRDTTLLEFAKIWHVSSSKY